MIDRHASRDEAAAIDGALRDRLEGLLDALAPGWVRRGPKAYLAPASRTDLGSWQVDLGGPHRGRWARFSQGVKGGPLGLIAYVRAGENGPFRVGREDFEWARGFLGWSVPAGPALDTEQRAAERERLRKIREHEAKLDAEGRLEYARDIWRACGPIAHTDAERYLMARGLPGQDWPPSLGFHSGLRHPEGGIWPCLVGRLVGCEGAFRGVWRIFLAPGGGGKAPVETPKLGLGVAKGAAVRFGPATPTRLDLAEGIETTLAVRAIRTRYLGDDGNRGTWATLSTSGMVSVEIPPSVRVVTIWPDQDMPREGRDGRIVEPPGHVAARTLTERLRAQGIRVTCPDATWVGRDPLDLWNSIAERVHA